MKKFAKALSVIMVLTMMFVTVAGLNVSAADAVVSFGDAKFESYIRGLIGRPSGTVYASQVAGIEVIEIANMGVKSLKGIEHMTGLWYLDCENNNITEVDLSKNLWLERVYFENNDLKTLNLENNQYIIDIFANDNENLREVKLRDRNQIQRIVLNNCNLDSLETWKCDILNVLAIAGNRFSDININSSLQIFDCSDNFFGNLYLRGYKYLKELYCDNNKIKNLDLSWTHELKVLSCSGNPIENLNLFYVRTLEQINFGDLSATLKHADFTETQIFGEGFYCEWVNLETLILAGQQTMKWADCSNLFKLKEFAINANLALEFLDVSGTQLKELDLGGLTGLKELYCVGAQLETLKLPHYSSGVLETLVCYGNNLQQLSYLERSFELKVLMCGNNPITNLNISQNSKLEFVEMFNLNLSNKAELLAMKNIAFSYNEDGVSYCSRKSDNGNILIKGPSDDVVPFLLTAENNQIHFGYDLAVSMRFKELKDVSGISNITEDDISNIHGYFTADYTSGDVYLEFVFEEPVMGDINADGKINVTDVVEIRKLVMSGKHYNVSDLNGDGKTNVTDVVELRKLIMAN